MEGQKILLKNLDGKETEITAIARWINDNNSYVAYTIENESEDVYISKIINENGNAVLKDIESDEEWIHACDYLDKYMFKVGDNDGH